eukprot:GFYU01051900.1.p1 GENE.GFYU01051900.1~~GFYU01051900.1.p1  ORF type:complete len:107 (-),score=5.80 GFYU01051900.1:18-338(-)
MYIHFDTLFCHNPLVECVCGVPTVHIWPFHVTKAPTTHSQSHTHSNITCTKDQPFKNYSITLRRRLFRICSQSAVGDIGGVGVAVPVPVPVGRGVCRVVGGVWCGG